MLTRLEAHCESQRPSVLRGRFTMSTDGGRMIACRGRVAEHRDRVFRAFGVVS
jgi:hypothetical protein